MALDKNLHKEKVLFIHNTLMWYRKPFFKELSKIYDLKLVLTHIDVSKDIYNVETREEIEGLEGVNVTALKNNLGIAFGVINKSLQDYDVLVGGSWDTVPELVETILFFVAAKLKRKKFILWREDWDWKSKNFKMSLIMPLIKFIVKSSDAIIVPGVKHREYFISLGSRAEKTFIMPNVSNISLSPEECIKEDEIRNKLNLNNEKIVLYVGRLIKRKGVDYLIKAFDKLRNDIENSVLMIIGDGNCRSELESLSRKLKINDKVIFLGQIDNTDLPAYYSLSDICVVPSITYEMGDPWVFILNEAMYFEKPVIATDAVGAAFDMIEQGENGFMVPEKNEIALYEAMGKILSNSQLESTMGKRSAEIIRSSFRYSNMVEGFKNAIDHVLNPNKQ